MSRIFSSQMVLTENLDAVLDKERVGYRLYQRTEDT